MTPSPNETALIRFVDASGVRHVHLLRPDKQNALTSGMMEDIAAAACGAAAAGNTLLVISAPGARNFCAGADLVEFSSGQAGLAAQEEGLHAMIHALHNLPLPVLVLAQGKALGAGGLLVTLADHTLVSDNFAFGFPEIQLKLYPVLMHAVLLDRISNAQAQQLCGSGRILNAEQAQAMGFVSEVLPSASFEAIAAQRVAQYAGRAGALAIGKRAARTVQGAEVFQRNLGLLEALGKEMMDGSAARAISEFRAQQGRTSA